MIKIVIQHFSVLLMLSFTFITTCHSSDGKDDPRFRRLAHRSASLGNLYADTKRQERLSEPDVLAWEMHVPNGCSSESLLVKNAALINFPDNTLLFMAYFKGPSRIKKIIFSKSPVCIWLQEARKAFSLGSQQAIYIGCGNDDSGKESLFKTALSAGNALTIRKDEKQEYTFSCSNTRANRNTLWRKLVTPEFKVPKGHFKVCSDLEVHFGIFIKYSTEHAGQEHFYYPKLPVEKGFPVLVDYNSFFSSFTLPKENSVHLCIDFAADEDRLKQIKGLCADVGLDFYVHSTYVVFRQPLAPDEIIELYPAEVAPFFKCVRHGAEL